MKFGADAKYIAVGSMDRNLRILGSKAACRPAATKLYSVSNGNSALQSVLCDSMLREMDCSVHVGYFVFFSLASVDEG